MDYEIDWSLWLDGDSIVTSNFTAPTGLTVTKSEHSDTTATVWLSDGTVNADYTVVNTITTALGRTESWAIRVLVRSTGAA